MRATFVGECNPYGGEPEYDLYPAPASSAGWNLCHSILQSTPQDYLTQWGRTNLCRGPWDPDEARMAAERLRAGQSCTASGRGCLEPRLVLLGAKVCRAFGVKYEPFGQAVLSFVRRALVLPHPSGLCREWNAEGSRERARAAIGEFLGVK